MKIRPLSDYPRPNYQTRLGFHGSANVYSPLDANLIPFLKDAGVSWITILSTEDGVSAEHLIEKLLAADIMPIIRMYRPQPNPGTLTHAQVETLKRWRNKFNRPLYIQYNNEPDLEVEWKGEHVPGNWLDVVAETSIHDCRTIQSIGHIPVLPPCATGSPKSYQYRLIPKILEKGGGDIFDGKLIAFGIHDYTTNHPVGNLPFENEAYPYDDVNQNGRNLAPGEYERYGNHAWDGQPKELINGWRTSDKNPGKTVVQDNMTILHSVAMYEMNVRGVLPGPIPFIGTEGGVTFNVRDDRRYPRVTHQLRVERSIEWARRLFRSPKEDRFAFPDWYFNCSWWLLHDGGAWAEAEWFKDGRPKEDIYRQFFDWTRANKRDMNFLYQSQSNPAPVPPTPTPPQPAPQKPARKLDYEGLPLSIEEPADLKDGETYWFIRRFEALNSEESHGMHNVYVRCFDENGNRLVGIPVTFAWPDGSSQGKTEEKPSGEWGDINFPMYGDWRPENGPGPYSVYVGSGRSEVARGMGLPVKQHFSYIIEFQKVVHKVEKPNPTPTPPQGEDLLTALINAAWNKVGVARNPDAWFFKYAAKYKLGRPVTNEFDVVYMKRTYRVQCFEQGIVFAEVVNGHVLINNTNHTGWFGK